MKRKERLSPGFILLLSIFYFNSFSQNTTYPLSETDKYHTAIELYENGNYGSALRLFEELRNETVDQSASAVESGFYKAMCSIHLKHNTAEKRLDNFIRQHPESPWTIKAAFEKGNFAFNAKQYPTVISAYATIKPQKLNREDRAKYYFQLGYSHFQKENYDEAATSFHEIKDRNNRFNAPAAYYWAHINYLQKNYETALIEFNTLKDNSRFASIIPFYITHIYYMQERYDEALNYAIPLYKKENEEKRDELAKIIGDCYFHQKNYPEAINYLKLYAENGKLKDPGDCYNMGYCYYQSGEFTEAIPWFEKSTIESSERAQNAYYHLADCYIKTDDKTNARMAFERASELDFDEAIKEDALFNYAKITYELSYSPFNETIKAFDKYIALYPDSKRNDAAYDYLIQVYMTTRNYKDAMASIEKIKVKSKAVKKAYQRVTYYRGIELFSNGMYTKAIDAFSTSLAQGDHDRGTTALARFWKAESHYRSNKYDQAVLGYNAFLRTPGAYNLDKYPIAQYNTAYAYFKKENYNDASVWFRKYIDRNKSNLSERTADAYNRLGDCYYIAREYPQAINYYGLSAQNGSYDADYALFQQAFCNGLQRNHQKKVELLSQLIDNYPESSMRDNAYYELGRAYEKLGDDDAAIGQYLALSSRFPESTYIPKACLQLGLIYYNNENYSKSLGYYKKIAEKYPKTKAATSALLGIKNNYIELNQIDNYVAYTRTLGGAAGISVSEQDSLMYTAAERLFMSNDSRAKTQLGQYVKNYPNGSFALNANFYLAELYYKDGEYSNALNSYEYITRSPDNIFSEQALEKACELRFNAKDYKEALHYFARLEKISNNKWNLLKSRVGKMRCYYELGQSHEAVSAANKLLKTENVSEQMIPEARFIMAKSHLSLSEPNKALALFKEVARDTRTKEGAEAKYRVAQLLFTTGERKAAEDEIMDFIAKKTPHQYWLAKAFILLADIYHEANDLFQSIHTIQSIIDNYPEKEDGIIDDAQRRIMVLKEQQKANQANNPESDFEINLNENDPIH